MGVVGRLDQYASMLAGEFDDYSMSENLVTDNATDFNYSFNNQILPTANDIAPDGRTVLCKHDLTGASSPFLNCRANLTLTAGTYTMSMYLKGTTSYSASFAFVGETTNEIYANTANITTAWQRFTLTFTLIATQTSSRLQLFFATQGEGKVVSVYGAQLERGSVATDYTSRISGTAINRVLASTTNTNITGLGTYYSSGFDENTGITTLVQTGENLFPWSETFTASNGWGGGGAINLDSSIVDPIGNTGTVYYPTLSEWVREFNGLGATTITLSFFTKVRSGGSGNTTYIQMYQETAIGEPSNVGAYNFDMVGSNLDSGRFTNITRTQYPNGWYRFTCKVTSNAGAGSGTFTSTSRVDLEGFQTTNYVWGIQVERGSVATDYIPTTGVSRSRSLPSPIFALSANIFPPYDLVYDDFGGTLFGAGQGRYMRQNTDKSVIVYNEIDEITTIY